MRPSRSIVQVTFNTSLTLRIIIKILTISIITIVIAAGIAVGVVVGTRKITALIETHPRLITESNMHIVLDRQVKSFEIAEDYYNNSQGYLTSILNETLAKTFPNSLLRVIISQLSLLPIVRADSVTRRYTFDGVAFFNRELTSSQIKDALELYKPNLTLLTTDGRLSTDFAYFDRFLSSVADTQPTNLTFADLDYITVPNVTTTVPNVTIIMPTVATTVPNVTTIVPNVITTMPNVITTVPNATITVPNVITTVPNATIIMPNVTTTVPNVTTIVPNVTTIMPTMTTTVPNVTITMPTVTTTVPNVTTTVPDVTTTVPNVTTIVPNVTTTQPTNSTLPSVSFTILFNLTVASSPSFLG
jgi:hypothetical protein